MRWWSCTHVMIGLVSGAPAVGLAAPADAFDVEVRWTRYGVPHVKARDYASLGYGYGYAVARDSLCLLVDRVVTLRGERSRWLGIKGATTVGFTKATNLDSDVFHRVQLSDVEVANASRALSVQARQLVGGYAAGFNRYVRDLKPGTRAEGCGGMPLPVMRATDVVRAAMQIGAMWKGADVAMAASTSTWEALTSPVSAASPPASPPAEEHARRPPGGRSLIGSNAWAYGSDVTGTGAAIVVANPHTAWTASWQRMHQIHLTIPGEMDVMGADFTGVPVPLVGYTRDIAWTIKSPLGIEFHVLLELDARAGPAPSYVVDGVARPLSFQTVELMVRADDGSLREQRIRVPRSHLGVIYKLAAAPGRRAGWYAITDPNAGNALGIDQILSVARARDMADFRRAVEQHRGFTARLIAGDRHGEVLYVDSGPVLDIDDQSLVRCFADRRRQAGGPRNVLNGARSECAVRTVAGRPRLAAARKIPAVMTRGIVEFATESHRYAIFGRDLTGYPLLMDDPSQEPGPRQRMSHRHIAEALVDGRVTLQEAIEVMLSNRNYAAETSLDAILAACRSADASSSAARACSILAAWDRRNDAASRGALMFAEAWPRIETIEGFHGKGFVATDPYAVLSVSTAPRVVAGILGALEHAAEALAALGLRGDEPWGSVLTRRTAGGRIALHGGDADQGVLNVVRGGPLREDGYSDIQYGSSYIQVVTWQSGQLVASLLLAHGQSPDPTSPHYSDQLELFAQKRLVRIPFSDAEISADESLEVLRLREGGDGLEGHDSGEFPRPGSPGSWR